MRGRNYPIESISQCKAKCNGDPKSTGFSLTKRYCQTLTRVCSPQSFQRQNSSQRLGRHYYVKSNNIKFNNNTVLSPVVLIQISFTTLRVIAILIALNLHIQYAQSCLALIRLVRYHQIITIVADVTQMNVKLLKVHRRYRP